MNKYLFAGIKVLFSVMILLLLVYGTVKLCHIGYDYGYRLFTDNTNTAAATEAE